MKDFDHTAYSRNVSRHVNDTKSIVGRLLPGAKVAQKSMLLILCVLLALVSNSDADQNIARQRVSINSDRSSQKAYSDSQLSIPMYKVSVAENSTHRDRSRQHYQLVISQRYVLIN